MSAPYQSWYGALQSGFLGSDALLLLGEVLLWLLHLEAEEGALDVHGLLTKGHVFTGHDREEEGLHDGHELGDACLALVEDAFVDELFELIHEELEGLHVDLAIALGQLEISLELGDAGLELLVLGEALKVVCFQLESCEA